MSASSDVSIEEDNGQPHSFGVYGWQPQLKGQAKEQYKKQKWAERQASLQTVEEVELKTDVRWLSVFSILEVSCVYGGSLLVAVFFVFFLSELDFYYNRWLREQVAKSQGCEPHKPTCAGNILQDT